MRLLLTLVLSIVAIATTAPAAPSNWPDFRGPTRDGIAPADAAPPTKWSETDRVKWKTAIPGQGHSSPIVWDEQIWLTTALNGGRSLHAICVDAGNGQIVHDIEVFADPAPGMKHNFNSYASPSAAVEAGRVYVDFGNAGIACLDTKSGKPIWTRKDLKLNYLTGAGSSPILYQNLLILECDGVDQQFVVAMDKSTGKDVWRTKRTKVFNVFSPQKSRSFSTPIIASIDGKDCLLSVGAGRTYGYDPLTGKELWNIDHGGYSNVGRPLFGDGMLFFSTGFEAAELLAVKVAGVAPAADGTPRHLADRDIAWRAKTAIPKKPSLLLVKGKIYTSSDNGVVQSLDSTTGKPIWSKRLGTAYSASPIFAGGHLYFFSEKGQVHVLRPGGDEPQIVSEIQMDEGFMASPAVVGNALILRTSGHLYRIE
jgi:outer membrane protein assembly factor BamB